MTETEILKAENAILTRALKWYANPENWKRGSFDVWSVIDPPDYGNPGAKARRALKLARKVK